MHKVVLKAREAVSVKCSSCKESLDIQANRHNHPVTMAFVHPKQCIRAKCGNCAKEFSWSPDELIKQVICQPTVSFSAVDLMTAHLEAGIEPAMA